MYELVYLLLFFGSIFFFDLVFKSCMLFPYIRFLHNTGIEIKPLGICWETTFFNRPLMRYGRIRPDFLRRWFNLGAFIVAISVIPALCIMYVPLLQLTHLYPVVKESSTPVLMPIIPGLNLPSSQLLYFLLSLFICVTFHEFGHALAASREKVPIEGFGIKIMGIFPIAYVRISLEHLGEINLTQQLRIYSAGVWHNLVLAMFALALVHSNPYILNPIYQQGKGVTVTDVKQGSGLGQKGGLLKDDTIIGVNECFVRTEADWKTCIHDEYHSDPSGFCAYESFFLKEDISIQRSGNSDCCPKNSDLMCFRIAQKESVDNVFKGDLGKPRQLCLPARKLAENAKMCWNERDCYEHFCLLPDLNWQLERLLRIKLSSQRTVYYVGQIEDIFSSVAVSPWTSHYASVFYIDGYELLIGYIFSFSFGIGVINAIPLFWFDGKFIIHCIIHGYCALFIPRVDHRCKLVRALQVSGCVGLVLSVSVGFVHLYSIFF